MSGVFVFIIYNFNQDFDKKMYSDITEIKKIKSKQNTINSDFQNQQILKQESIKTLTYKELNSDNDGDGLTKKQEMSQGTSDNSKDSDSDGIDDKEDKHPAGGGKNYKHSVTWRHKSLSYSTQFGIPEDLYWYFKNKKRSYCCDGWSVFATPQDKIIKTIAKDIVDVSISTGDSCKACIAIDFVQSMVYQFDVDYNGRNEYPKYPIETIVDGSGDCEDTSFLMASILEAIGIDTILFVLPSHVAVGVACKGCTGEYHSYKGTDYYFLETTGYADNWELGNTRYNLKKDLKQIIEV